MKIEIIRKKELLKKQKLLNQMPKVIHSRIKPYIDGKEKFVPGIGFKKKEEAHLDSSMI